MKAELKAKSAAKEGDLSVRGNGGWDSKTYTPRIKEPFDATFAENDVAVDTAEDVSAAVPITFTLSLQPDVPRTLTWGFIAHTNVTAFHLVFLGEDARGNTIAETFTQATGWSGETINAYARITSIKLTSRTGTGATDTMKVGFSSKIGLANQISKTTDVYKVSFNSVDALPGSYVPIVVGSLVDFNPAGMTPFVAFDFGVISYKAPMLVSED